jgi:hypothetical protein
MTSVHLAVYAGISHTLEIPNADPQTIASASCRVVGRASLVAVYDSDAAMSGSIWDGNREIARFYVQPALSVAGQGQDA